MSTVQSCFQRIEKKISPDGGAVPRHALGMRAHMRPDRYSHYTLCSVSTMTRRATTSSAPLWKSPCTRKSSACAATAPPGTGTMCSWNWKKKFDAWSTSAASTLPAAGGVRI